MSRNKQSMHAELETALSELHLSTERWEAILAAAGRMTERENRRRPLRTGLMAAAICAALAVTAVAVSPPLRETLIQFLGSFEPYAQEVEGVSATDQGIELRVVRVLADKNGGTAYLEAEDLVGERLHESAALESYRDPCIAYDAEADTALFALALDDIAPCQMETGDVYTLEFSRILPSVEPFFAHLPWELLTGERLDTLTVATEKYISGEKREETRTVLVPGQTPAELGRGFPHSAPAGGRRRRGIRLPTDGYAAGGVGGGRHWGDPHHIPVGRNIVLRYPVPYADGGAFRPVPH